MDFITKGDRRYLKHTEMLYGKKSEQYKLHSILLNAENILKTKGILVLGKMCKHEYIEITFITKIFDTTTVSTRIKRYWSINKDKINKVKESAVNKSISSLINSDVYDLILNGYNIIE